MMFLWRSVWVRHAVIAWVSMGWPGSVWCCRHTLLLDGLHRMWIDRGELENAARVVQLKRDLLSRVTQ